jgi:purine-binding chemotaxis protein CheW
MYCTEPQALPTGKLEFLSFQLGGLDYGVEFRKVKELRTLKSLERFASDGTIVKGVATDVIILQLASCVVGMVVDGVTDVVRLYADQITPIPGADGEGECDYLLGLGEADGRRLILVDIDRLMSIRREPARDEKRVA